MILKTLWAHRKQNGFVFAEIALIAILSFWLLDQLTLQTYSQFFCRADGEFEKEHLVVGLVGYHGATSDSEDNGQETDAGRKKSSESQDLPVMASLYAFRDHVRSLPEVQSVTFVDHYLGCTGGYRGYRMSPEADTTIYCSTHFERFPLDFNYFETWGMKNVEGSPSLEALSKDCPTDGVVITRSLAMQLFGTADVVGRRVLFYTSRIEENFQDKQLTTHHTVAGVVEDVKPMYVERYHYIAFFPYSATLVEPQIVIRLKPGMDADGFVSKYSPKPFTLSEKVGDHGFHFLSTYNQYKKREIIDDDKIIQTVLGTFGLMLVLNVILGTLGTFWLQIRKRTEDIGIMRSFGAKRRHIFGMVWSEGALLTLFATIVGQLIWLQFALHYGLADGNIRATSGRETDWTTIFWVHFLVICVVQYLLFLAVVTVGMIVPSLIAIFKRPVEALHHE
jgi:hypothetical protein